MEKTESMVHPIPSESVGIALARLRGGVSLCCLATMIALGIHVVVWAIVVFTDTRFDAPEKPDESINIVVREAGQMEIPVTVDSLKKVDEIEGFLDMVPQSGSLHRALGLVVSLAGGFGTLAMMCLVGLIGVGVLLAAGSATRGVEQTVGAFTWTMVVGLLVLPLGNVVGLPWGAGALASFEAMVESGEALGFTVYAKFLVLPLTCLSGLGLVMWRFRAGVKAAMLPPAYHIDPVLEKEAANIKADNLHAGRGGHALKRVMDDETIAGPSQFPLMPRASEVSAGEPQKRLI